MTTPVLEARDLARTYGRGPTRFDALKGVSLQVHQGESLAIVGKSGSGKSTLMHLLALLDTPTSGALVVDGHSAESLKGKQLNELRNRTFGFVFQQFFLTPNASVLENVMLPLTIAGVRTGERAKRSHAALAQLEMDDKAKNKAPAVLPSIPFRSEPRRTSACTTRPVSAVAGIQVMGHALKMRSATGRLSSIRQFAWRASF